MPSPEKAASPWISTGIPRDRSRIPHVVLARAHRAEDHRIHELEVAGIEVEIQIDRAAVGGGAQRRIAEVVLYVPVALHITGREIRLELAEDHIEWLVQDVGQDVEPATMGHSDHDLLDSDRRGRVDQSLEHRNQRGGAFERESFLSYVLHVQELLEGVGDPQSLQQVDTRRGLEDGTVADRLHALLEPFASLALGDPHELDADRAAVGVAQGRDQVAHHTVHGPAERVVPQRPVQVGRGQAMGRGIELPALGRGLAQRVDPGDPVAEFPVRVHEPDDAAGGYAGDRSEPACAAQLEAGKEHGPVGRDRGRILPKAVVKAVDVGRVGLVDGVERVGHEILEGRNVGAEVITKTDSGRSRGTRGSVGFFGICGDDLGCGTRGRLCRFQTGLD